jgi:superkiller protein 3
LVTLDLLIFIEQGPGVILSLCFAKCTIMSSSKAALKSIKAAIDKSDFSAAAEQAAEFVKHDSKNYTAYVFLGFARDKLDQNAEAENAYRKATSIKPGDFQALKGLITLYEKQGSEKLDEYHDIVHQLAELLAASDDRTQCQTVVEKYERFAKKHGSRAQYRHALELQLPSSSLYDALEGRVPRPSHTYTRILESAEAEEKEWINNQIGERRTRLGARIDQVTQQVKLEAEERFQLQAKYRTVIDWMEDDDTRHGYEEKLLQRAYDTLAVLPADLKPAQRDAVLTMANGMVIIKHPFPLAWQIALEWVDAEELGEWDVGIFRECIVFFPDAGLSKVLRGFLNSNNSPFPKPTEAADESSSDVEQDEALSEADRLVLMNEGLEDSPDSLLSNRIMAETYLSLDEFRSAVEAARKAQSLHLQSAQKFGLEIQSSIDSVNITLANALISYQSPRHHPEAKALFETILQRKTTATAPLLGVGLILEEDEDYKEAVKFLERALQRDPQNIRIRLELAWCRALDGDLYVGLAELEAVLIEVEAQKPVNLALKSETLYRIGYCKWHLDTSQEARKDKNGAYKYLLDSIKANNEYAPPYTLLGLYFEDYGKSKKRARVAFQKAFELSTSEIEAAERLAKNFSMNGEWDLVELVAQRAIDSGKARPAPASKKKAYSWPYAALGIVEMSRQQYAKSIVAYQAALRIAPDDYHCWVGLGESYHNSGRYIAATRAFHKAESLDHGLPEDQTWFAKYMLANVQREIGAYDEATEGYRSVLRIKENDFGVLVALLQTLTESAWGKIDLGMFGEASNLARQAFQIATEVAGSRSYAFNLWKAVADACSVLAFCKAYTTDADVLTVSSLLEINSSREDFDFLSDVDKIEISSLSREQNEHDTHADAPSRCLLAAVLSNKRAIHAAAQDIHAQAVAWYNLGWAEYQVYTSTDPQLQTKGKKVQRFLKAAMRCFKRAIELEAGNSEFWNALGVVTLALSPKVSQHSFIRSLHLDERSARAWTNLGVLYLLNNDNELANEAFTRAQSADPEYAHAWLGQGILATLYGNAKEARGLFAHAFEIASSSSLPTRRRYALSAFDHLVKSTAASEELASVIQPLFALHQLRSCSPSEMLFNHLSALLAERLGNYEEAADILQIVCSQMENEYERSESKECLARFAQAKSDLARAHLAQRDFQAAKESAQMALDLSPEDDFGPSHAEARQRLRLSAHLTAGLSHYYGDEFDQSIEMFQAALKEANGEPDVVCMLSQVLWAKGGQDQHEIARDKLLDCIEKRPDHVGAVTLLGVIALLDDDNDAIEAVEEDLQAMRLNDRLGVHDRLKVAKVLAGVTACSAPATEEHDQAAAAMSDATRGVMLAPAQPQGWSELAAVTNDPFPAEMALQNASRQVPPGGTLQACDLSKAYAQTGKRQDAMQSIMVAPWLEQGYKTFADSL